MFVSIQFWQNSWALGDEIPGPVSSTPVVRRQVVNLRRRRARFPVTTFCSTHPHWTQARTFHLFRPILFPHPREIDSLPLPTCRNYSRCTFHTPVALICFFFFDRKNQLLHPRTELFNRKTGITFQREWGNVEPKSVVSAHGGQVTDVRSSVRLSEAEIIGEKLTETAPRNANSSTLASSSFAELPVGGTELTQNSGKSGESPSGTQNQKSRTQNRRRLPRPAKSNTIKNAPPNE